MAPCYCGGCSACLRDQGFDPDACPECGEDCDCELGALRSVNAECAEYDGEDE